MLAAGSIQEEVAMGEYDRWQGRYAAPEYIFGEGPNAFLGAQGPLLPAKGRALAVADGEGRNGVWLAEQGLDVLSIDFAPNGQAKAKALAGGGGRDMGAVQGAGEPTLGGCVAAIAAAQ
jgi:hypothetical protein